MEINIFPGAHHPFPLTQCNTQQFFFFFFNGGEKALSCVFEQAETGGHLGLGRGLWRVPWWPLLQWKETGCLFPRGGVGKEQALQVLAPLVGRVVAQANPGLPETPALLSAS